MPIFSKILRILSLITNSGFELIIENKLILKSEKFI